MSARRFNLTAASVIGAALAALVALVACDKVAGPPLPGDAQQFSPPVVYSKWWQMTRECSGLSGSLEAVSWFKTDEVQHDARTGEIIIGYFTTDGNKIVMSSGSILDGGAVRHEMLHALLRQPGHPRAQFLGSCAGTVDCQGPCISDGGPYPAPPQAPMLLSADGLIMSVQVDPQNPGGGQNDNYFTITVFARNPTANWASIIPLFPDVDTTRTFSFVISGANGGMGGGGILMDPSQRIFAPGETKRMVFDFNVGDAPFGNQLNPGSYVARGAFSTFWSSDLPFVVTR